MKVDVKFDAKQLIDNLKKLSNREIKNATRKAINAATNPTLKASRANVPVESGALKKSIIKKVKTYPSGVVVGIIGPDSSYTQDYTRTTTINGKKIIEIEKRRPVKYAHLVEFGTSHSVGLRPFTAAYESTKDQALTILGEKFNESVEGLIK